MGEVVMNIKGMDFRGWPIERCLGYATVYENCNFIHARLVFNSGVKNITFKNCSFSLDSHLVFIFFDGSVRFENCIFRSSTEFNGAIIGKGSIKFIECIGLKGRMFRLKNCSQTLSEMGLYQIFRRYIFNSRIEETVYKKIGIYTLYDDGCLKRWVPVGYAIATLTIPKGTVRYGDRNQKCRCERAIVTDILPYTLPSIMQNHFVEKPDSFRYGSVRDGGVTAYEVGKEVKPDKFDYIPNVCSSGIHYFYDFASAAAYDFS